MTTYWFYAKTGVWSAIVVSIFVLLFPVYWFFEGTFEWANFFGVLAFVAFIWGAILIGRRISWLKLKKRKILDET
jgi:glycerol-3-phosphate acyltransferase PlsY